MRSPSMTTRARSIGGLPLPSMTRALSSTTSFDWLAVRAAGTAEMIKAPRQTRPRKVDMGDQRRIRRTRNSLTLETIVIPRIAKPAVFGASIKQPDALTNRRVTFHFLTTFRALVQLFPAAFRRLLVCHLPLRRSVVIAHLDTSRPVGSGLERTHSPDHGSRRTDSGQKHALTVIHPE